jgi:hypothetical protein
MVQSREAFGIPIPKSPLGRLVSAVAMKTLAIKHGKPPKTTVSSWGAADYGEHGEAAGAFVRQLNAVRCVVPTIACRESPPVHFLPSTYRLSVFRRGESKAMLGSEDTL